MCEVPGSGEPGIKVGKKEGSGDDVIAFWGNIMDDFLGTSKRLCKSNPEKKTSQSLCKKVMIDSSVNHEPLQSAEFIKSTTIDQTSFSSSLYESWIN